MVEGQLYSIHPDLIDWDQGVEEWKEDIMGQWPFGIQPTTDQRLLEEALNCLNYDNSTDDYRIGASGKALQDEGFGIYDSNTNCPTTSRSSKFDSSNDVSYDSPRPSNWN